MFAAIKEYVQNAAIYVLTNYAIPVSWALSFFVNRLITKTPEESYKQSGMMAAGVAGIAAIDYHLRDQEYVSTYAVTYATMAVSSVVPFLYYREKSRVLSDLEVTEYQFFDDNLLLPLINLHSGIVVVCGGVITFSSVGAVVHYGYVPQAISPAVTGFANYNIHGPTAAIASAALSVVDELMIYNNITDKHYLSVFSLSQGVSGYFLPNKLLYTAAISTGASSVVAPYEAEILEAFLPINSTKQTYNLLLEISGGDVKQVNKILEVGLVITGNIEMSYGILFMKMLKMVNQWFVLFGEACKDPALAPQFIDFSKKSINFDAARIIGHGLPLIPIEDLMLWSVKKHFKDQLFEQTLYKPSNFMLVSKSNYTAEIYSQDVSTIISTHWLIYQELTKSLPSLVMLTSFGKNIVIVPALAGVDYFCTMGLNGLQTWMQKLNEERGMAFSNIGVIEKHDREYANSLIQTGAVLHMKNQWQFSIDNVDKLVLDSELASDVHNSIYGFYWEVGIWGMIPVVVVKLAASGKVASDGMFTSLMAIKNSIGSILIKSKKQQQLNNAEISINRLHSLFDSIKDQVKLNQNVTISYKDGALEVDHLTYVRGNNDGNVTVSVPSVSFTMGKKYVITGGNGSGKSSFLLLLNLLLGSINEDSFLRVEGSVSYPVGQMSVVTQKEYCCVKTDMFSWLVYPKEPQQFSDKEKQDYQVKIIKLLEKLKFSPKNLTAVAEEFHTVKNNWCGDLSGGQVKKIQLMQQVFLPDECPKVLLMDEVMGPLDPESKTIVEQMIMDRCKNSLIISVHHYDGNVSCAPNDGIYDHNLHFENGTAAERPLCGEGLSFV